MSNLNKISVKVNLDHQEDGEVDNFDRVIDAFEVALDHVMSEFGDPLDNFFTMRFDEDQEGDISATVTAQRKRGE